MMTDEDIQATVELVEEGAFRATARKTLSSLSTKVGNLERERRYEIAAVLFLKLMQQLGGTYIWKDGPKRGWKFADVFQALAAEMQAFEEKSLKEKSDHVEEYGPKLRTGFYAARRWLSEWYGETVFCVPATTESGVLTVITLDHGLHLGDGSESAITAAQMQQLRDEKLAKGQLTASAKRMNAATKDKAQVRTRINDVVEKALADIEAFKGSKVGIEDHS
jgi:hypothetical protein